MPAPLVVFAFNRPKHLQMTLESVLKNPLAKQSELYIFSDGPRGEQDLPLILKVREYLDNVTGFKRIHRLYQEKNLGLANSVIQGLSQVLAQDGKAIVIEDDLLCSPDLLEYLNEGLEIYATRPDIFSLSGYRFPFKLPAHYTSSVYLLPRPSSYGWATWKDRWEKVDWSLSDFPSFIRDVKARQRFNQGGIDLSPMLINYKLGWVNSWAIRWAYAHCIHQAYGVCPVEGKVKHIGIDGSGTHYTLPSLKNIAREESPASHAWEFPDDLEPEADLISKFAQSFRQSPIRKMINYWRRAQAQRLYPLEGPRE